MQVHQHYATSWLQTMSINLSYSVTAVCVCVCVCVCVDLVSESSNERQATAAGDGLAVRSSHLRLPHQCCRCRVLPTSLSHILCTVVISSTNGYLPTVTVRRLLRQPRAAESGGGVQVSVHSRGTLGQVVTWSFCVAACAHHTSLQSRSRPRSRRHRAVRMRRVLSFSDFRSASSSSSSSSAAAAAAVRSWSER